MTAGFQSSILVDSNSAFSLRVPFFQQSDYARLATTLQEAGECVRNYQFLHRGRNGEAHCGVQTTQSAQRYNCQKCDCSLTLLHHV